MVRVQVSLSAIYDYHGVDASPPVKRTYKYERLFFPKEKTNFLKETNILKIPERGNLLYQAKKPTGNPKVAASEIGYDDDFSIIE